MKNHIDFSREEINLLNELIDPEGHYWLLYLALKNSVKINTNIVGLRPGCYKGLSYPKIIPEKFKDSEYLKNLLLGLAEMGLIKKIASTNLKEYWQLPFYSYTLV